MSPHHLRNALLLAFFALLSACAPRPIGKPVVWPDPPDTARIRFVTAFRQSKDLDNSGWSTFWHGLVGGNDEQGIGQPMGLAISDDEKRLYIADFSMGHVFVADFEEKRLRAFAPDVGMGKPFGVAIDGSENVYATDSIGKVVNVFSKTGEKLLAIGRNELERPTGVAVDRERKRLYVSDSANRGSTNHRVRAFTLEGKLLFDLSPKQGPGGKGDEDGQFYFPTYLALDTAGNVYVSDSMNFRIQVFDTNGKFLKKYGTHGDAPGDFSRLKGIAFDTFGNLYAVDGGHSNVQVFNKEFQPLLFFGGYSSKIEYFDLPSGIAISRNNKIYVCNEFFSRINVYELINTAADDSKAPPPKPGTPSAPPLAAAPAKDGAPLPSAPGTSPVDAKSAVTGTAPADVLAGAAVPAAAPVVASPPPAPPTSVPVNDAPSAPSPAPVGSSGNPVGEKK